MRMVLAAASVLAFLTIVGASAAGPGVPRGLDQYRPVPEDNALTPAKIALGRRLFHDRQLSPDGKVSCATCHDPGRAFAGDRSSAVRVGRSIGRRDVPAIINRAWGRSFFWDGRAASLEEQALQPILNPLELGASRDHVLSLVRSRSYIRDFQRAFGADPVFEDVARAVASYVRTIVAGDSPFDRYRDGDRSALTRQEERGVAVFFGPGRCASCHSGPTFTDELFHNTGVAWRDGDNGIPVVVDLGRAAVTSADKDRGAFKTPTLREVARTAPYMHDGSIATLEDVVELYDLGGRFNPGLDPKIRALGLSSPEKADLVAFLRALSGRVTDGR